LNTKVFHDLIDYSDPEDGGSKVLWDLGYYLRVTATAHPRTYESSLTLLW